MKLRDDRLQGFAHRMRREPTPFEVILWRHLSRSQLGGHKFRRQAVIEDYVVDFFCPQKMLVVEVDGDTHDAVRDQRRDAALAVFGIKTIRFTNVEVARQTEGVLATILCELAGQPDRFRKGAHPNPSHEWEGLEGPSAAKHLPLVGGAGVERG